MSLTMSQFEIIAVLFGITFDQLLLDGEVQCNYFLKPVLIFTRKPIITYAVLKYFLYISNMYLFKETL